MLEVDSYELKRSTERQGAVINNLKA